MKPRSPPYLHPGGKGGVWNRFECVTESRREKARSQWKGETGRPARDARWRGNTSEFPAVRWVACAVQLPEPMQVLPFLRRLLLPATVAGALAVGVFAGEKTASAQVVVGVRPMAPRVEVYGPRVGYGTGWGYGPAYRPGWYGRGWGHPGYAWEGRRGGYGRGGGHRGGGGHGHRR